MLSLTVNLQLHYVTPRHRSVCPVGRRARRAPFQTPGSHPDDGGQYRRADRAPFVARGAMWGIPRAVGASFRRIFSRNRKRSYRGTVRLAKVHPTSNC